MKDFLDAMPVPNMDKVTVVDLKGLSTDESHRKQMALEMREGFMQHGFISVINHNIAEDTITNVWQKMDQFFSLPINVKEKYLVSSILSLYSVLLLHCTMQFRSKTMVMAGPFEFCEYVFIL